MTDEDLGADVGRCEALRVAGRVADALRCFAEVVEAIERDADGDGLVAVTALAGKAECLVELGRDTDAIDAFAVLRVRFAGVAVPGVAAVVRDAMVDAVAACDRVVSAVSAGSGDQSTLGNALGNKAMFLEASGASAELRLAALDAVFAMNGVEPGEPMSLTTAWTLHSRAAVLSELGRNEEALADAEAIVTAGDGAETGSEPPFFADAMYRRCLYLHRLGRLEVVEAADAYVERFRDQPMPTKQWVAAAMWFRCLACERSASTVVDAKRRARDGLSSLEVFLRGAPESVLRWRLAQALVKKVQWLLEDAHPADAREATEEVRRLLEVETDRAAMRGIAGLLLECQQLLVPVGGTDRALVQEAAQISRVVIERLSGSDDPDATDLIADARLNLVIALGRLGPSKDLDRAAGDLADMGEDVLPAIDRNIGAIQSSDAVAPVAGMLEMKAMILVDLGRTAEADAVAADAIDHFQNDPSSEVQARVGALQDLRRELLLERDARDR
jgi:tetratricopeptide (TPR) repeat protein